MPEKCIYASLTKGSGLVSLISLVMHQRKFPVARGALSFYLPLAEAPGKSESDSSLAIGSASPSSLASSVMTTQEASLGSVYGSFVVRDSVKRRKGEAWRPPRAS